MEFNQLVAYRRAVYPSQFEKGEIDQETILELLKNANMAPTHKMTQPWFFKVYKKKSKEHLAAAMVQAMKKHKVEDLRNSYLERKILNKCQMSNYVIGIFMKRTTAISIPEWEEIAAVAMAVQNIWLSCADKKIGCYWSSPKYVENMNSFFDLSHNERCLGFMYLGKFDHSTLPIKDRESIESKVEWLD